MIKLTDELITNKIFAMPMILICSCKKWIQWLFQSIKTCHESFLSDQSNTNSFFFHKRKKKGKVHFFQKKVILCKRFADSSSPLCCTHKKALFCEKWLINLQKSNPCNFMFVYGVSNITENTKRAAHGSDNDMGCI